MNSASYKPLTNLYLLLTITCLPSLYYWLSGLNWDLSKLNIANIFPLFGLLAFSIMWLHLMVAWYKRYNPQVYDYRKFFRQTSNLVLVFIILHPLLLIIRSLSLDIKPLEYAGLTNQPFILMGTTALVIFLVYDVVDRLRSKPIIQNNWPIIVGFNRAAVILIYFHALQLGRHLQSGFFKTIWYFFGLTLLCYFIASYIHELKKKKPNAS